MRLRPFPTVSLVRASLLLVAAVYPSFPGPCQGGSPGRSREITPQLRNAIDRGLGYLIRNQKRTNSFAGSDGFEVAIDALGGLAFLAGGHTDREGEYTREVSRALANLLGRQNALGYFDDGKSRMYGHGFATLFLAQLYGMTGDRNRLIRKALTRAVRLIENSQGPDGGWDYEPVGLRGSDTSITVCQTMALRAARNLGLHIDVAVIKRARRYIQRAQNNNGGFCYRIENGRRMGISQFPRSAAGVCILCSLAGPEDFSSTRLKKGFDFLLRNYRSFSQFPFYGDYYCAQAMFQAGGKYWAEYYPYLRERLIGNQRADGSWKSWGMELTPQATAMALIALQVPFRFLPIFER